MKLKGELKEKVEKAENKEQAKEILDNTGIELTDDELEAVSGGLFLITPDRRQDYQVIQ